MTAVWVIEFIRKNVAVYHNDLGKGEGVNCLKCGVEHCTRMKFHFFPPCGSICGSEIVPGQWRAIPGASLWHAGDALYKLLVWLLYLHTVCRVPWFQLTFHHFFFGGVQFYKLSGAFFFLNQTFVICEPFQYHAFWTNFGA